MRRPADAFRSPTESDDLSVKPWRESIERMYVARTNAAATESRPVFSPPTSVLEIEGAETRLGARFPETLKSLLLECDGIMDQLSVDGGPYFDNMWLLWPVRQIVDENMALRKGIGETGSNRVGHDFVFIVSAGVDGILFGIEATGKPRDDSSIVVWYPIEDRICKLADTFAEFLDGWLSNGITV